MNIEALCIRLDVNDVTPLYLQLYQQLKNCILNQKLDENVRLPATRSLAKQ